jgi:hypothetical protein
MLGRNTYVTFTVRASRHAVVNVYLCRFVRMNERCVT